jgi:hypothetical protein
MVKLHTVVGRLQPFNGVTRLVRAFSPDPK